MRRPLLEQEYLKIGGEDERGCTGRMVFTQYFPLLRPGVGEYNPQPADAINCHPANPGQIIGRGRHAVAIDHEGPCAVLLEEQRCGFEVFYTLAGQGSMAGDAIGKGCGERDCTHQADGLAT
jgi:hypothetical protein